MPGCLTFSLKNKKIKKSRKIISCFELNTPSADGETLQTSTKNRSWWCTENSNLEHSISLEFTLELCSRDNIASFLSRWVVSALTVSSFRFNASTDVTGLDRTETDNRMTMVWSRVTRQSVVWGKEGAQTLGLEPGERYRWSLSSVNTCGDFLMRGRQQLKDSKGRWVHDSPSLVILYHQWKMLVGGGGVELLCWLMDCCKVRQWELSQGGNSLFCTLQIRSFVCYCILLITILTLTR